MATPVFTDDGFYPEIYTKGLDFTNLKSDFMQSRLRFSYWKWMLKVIISPLTKDSAGKWTEVKEEKMITLLDQRKVSMLLQELEAFEKGTGNRTSYGIKFTKTVVYITNNNPDKKVLFVIRKFKDDMCTQFDKEAVYEFNTGAHFAVRNCEEKDMSGSVNVPYPEIEFKMLKLILVEYLKAFTGASVGSLAYYGRDAIYDRANVNLASIASKMGVKLTNYPYPKGDSKSTVPMGNNKSAFSNNKSESTKSTLNDIDGLVD